MSHFGLNPGAVVRWQSASYGKITKAGPAHARGMQIAVVTTARKLTTLCWHLVIKGDDYVVLRVAQPGVPGVRPAGRHDRSTATFSVGTEPLAVGEQSRFKRTGRVTGRRSSIFRGRGLRRRVCRSGRW